MNAIQLRSHGAPDSAVFCRVPRPEPQPGEALVRLRAAALNRVDAYMRDSGAGITHSLPMVMGVDGAGEVVAVNDPACAFKPGEAVVLYPAVTCGRCRFCRAGNQSCCVKVRFLGEHRDGTFAEFVTVPTENLMALPAGLDFRQAACLPVAYLTAWSMLFGKARLSAGETVAVIGVGGGVAVAAVQFARLTGARVIATSGSDDKLERARDLGADGLINYRREDVARRLLDLTGGAGADVIVDSVGGPGWTATLKGAARRGRIVTCGATAGSQPGADLQRIFVRQLQIFGSTLGSQDEFRALLEAVRVNRLAPVVDSTWPLAEALDGLARLERGDQFGKIAIEVAA